MIISFEAYSPIPYWDVNGWAIGYGHHGPEVRPGLYWSKGKANAALRQDVVSISSYIGTVSPNCVSYCRISISDFVYNLGRNAYRTSTLKKRVDAKDWNRAQKEIMRWNHVNGQVNPGLTKRRQVEANLLGEMK